MDPNVTLGLARAAARGARKAVERHDFHGRMDMLMELLDCFENLDDWLTGGGLPPNDWIVANAAVELEELP